jgi:hypothetical protein
MFRLSTIIYSTINFIKICFGLNKTLIREESKCPFKINNIISLLHYKIINYISTSDAEKVY